MKEQKGPAEIDFPFRMPDWYRKLGCLFIDLIAGVLAQGSLAWNKRVWLFFARSKYRLLVWERIEWKYLTSSTVWYLTFPKPGEVRGGFKGELVYGPKWQSWQDQWKERKI